MCRPMNQVVTLILDSKPTSVLCHMGDFGCGNGGWTLVMKMDGNKVWHFLGIILSLNIQCLQIIFTSYFSLELK